MKKSLSEVINSNTKAIEENARSQKTANALAAGAIAKSERAIGHQKESNEIQRKQLDLQHKQFAVQQGQLAEAKQTNAELVALNATNREIEKNTERMASLQAELLSVAEKHLDVSRSLFLHAQLQSECLMEARGYARLERALRNSIYGISGVVNSIGSESNAIARYFVLKKNRCDVDVEQIYSARVDSIADKLFIDDVTFKLDDALDSASKSLSDEDQSLISKFSKTMSDIEADERRLASVSAELESMRKRKDSAQGALRHYEVILASQIADRARAGWKALFLFILVFPVLDYLKKKRAVSETESVIAKVKSEIDALSSSVATLEDDVSKVKAELEENRVKRDDFLGNFSTDVRSAILSVTNASA